MADRDYSRQSEDTPFFDNRTEHVITSEGNLHWTYYLRELADKYVPKYSFTTAIFHYAHGIGFCEVDTYSNKQNRVTLHALREDWPENLAKIIPTENPLWLYDPLTPAPPSKYEDNEHGCALFTGGKQRLVEPLTRTPKPYLDWLDAENERLGQWRFIPDHDPDPEQTKKLTPSAYLEKYGHLPLTKAPQKRTLEQLSYYPQNDSQMSPTLFAAARYAHLMARLILHWKGYRKEWPNYFDRLEKLERLNAQRH
jgi:hypothetical protein